METFVDWSVNTDGEVDLLVKWRGHEGDSITWESLPQLLQDLAALIAKYVRENTGWSDLDREYKKTIPAAERKK